MTRQSDPPHPPDPRPGAAQALADLTEQDVRVVLALILDSQRQILPVADGLMHARERRELAMASVLSQAASLIEVLSRSYWSAPSLLVAVVGAVLLILHVAGVETQQLLGLADVAAHAWSGEPHCPEAVGL